MCCQFGKDFLFWTSISYFLGSTPDSTTAVLSIPPFHPEKELRVRAWCCILSMLFFFFFFLGFELLILIFSCKSGALPALFKPPRYPFCTLNKRLLAVASQSVAVRIRSIMLQVLAKALERLSHRKKIEYSLILRLIFKKYVPRMKKIREEKDTFKILLKIILKYFDEMTLENLKTDQK